MQDMASRVVGVPCHSLYPLPCACMTLGELIPCEGADVSMTSSSSSEGMSHAAITLKYFMAGNLFDLRCLEFFAYL